MKSLLSILTALFVVAACATSARSDNETDSGSTVSDNSQQTETPAATDGDQTQERTFFAGIKRGACYGTCPTYTMTIYSDGFVELEGIRFMEPLGKHTGTISQKQMQSFIDKANYIEFFNMEDSYDSPVTDIPAVTTSISINGKKKTVLRRVNYPERILTFEALFDDLLKSVSWTKVEED